MQNPYSRSRFTSGIGGNKHTGNPNKVASVFTPREHKRLKTQSTSTPRENIDLTADDAGPVSHTSVVAEDSDDSLNLRDPKERIAKDGPATRRLNERRDAGSSKAVHSDTETEGIDDFPETTRKPVGRVEEKIRFYEFQNGTPKLPLELSNPLVNVLPKKPTSKASLLFTGKEGRPADTLITSQSSTFV
jgi:hypothetical protein